MHLEDGMLPIIRKHDGSRPDQLHAPAFPQNGFWWSFDNQPDLNNSLVDSAFSAGTCSASICFTLFKIPDKARSTTIGGSPDWLIVWITAFSRSCTRFVNSSLFFLLLTGLQFPVFLKCPRHWYRHGFTWTEFQRKINANSKSCVSVYARYRAYQAINGDWRNSH